MVVSGYESQHTWSAGSGSLSLNDFRWPATVACLFLSCSSGRGSVLAPGHPASTLAPFEHWFTLPESSLVHITNAASYSILSFLALAQMCPVPSAVHQDPICCECQARFGGHLPVPRAEAALPYWVPLTLRPQKQVGDLNQGFFTWVQGEFQGTSHPSES